jgi:hypothetical protein
MEASELQQMNFVCGDIENRQPHLLPLLLEASESRD